MIWLLRAMGKARNVNMVTRENLVRAKLLRGIFIGATYHRYSSTYVHVNLIQHPGKPTYLVFSVRQIIGSADRTASNFILLFHFAAFLFVSFTLVQHRLTIRWQRLHCLQIQHKRCWDILPPTEWSIVHLWAEIDFLKGACQPLQGRACERGGKPSVLGAFGLCWQPWVGSATQVFTENTRLLAPR